jgi:hypothetical protein
MFRFTYVIVFLCGAVFVAAGGAVLRWMKGRTNEPIHAAADDTRLNPSGQLGANSKAPWGELEITPLMLERPERPSDTNNAPAPPIRWLFQRYTSVQVSNLFASCGLSDKQRVSLLDPNRWEATPNGCRLWPALDAVKEMSPTAREKIYSVLAATPENIGQRLAFFYRADAFDEWVSGSELSAERLSLVRDLCYLKNGRLCFADIQLFELLTSFNEAQSLIRTLNRVPTLLMKIRVRPESDVEAMARYWGPRGKSEDVARLLRGLARAPDAGSIGVSYFMPPIPRTRLYTYPNATNAAREDCFWTAFNFWNERPDYGFSAPEYPNELLQREYSEVRGEKAFGDLLLLWEAGNTAVHMCVYVADDVVYTKNGGDFQQPWVLMRVKDLMVLYASERKQEWRIFRKNAS